MMETLEKVIVDINPDKTLEVKNDKKVKSFLVNLNKNLLGATAVIGGSFAKGTWLKGDHDVDIFVLYTVDEDISNKLEGSLKKSF